jgi:hypothetical protein
MQIDDELHRVDRFLNIFCDIEDLLCRRVAPEKINKKPNVSVLINQYAKRNPLWDCLGSAGNGISGSWR